MMGDTQCGEVSLEFNRHIINLLDSLSALSELAALSIHDFDEPQLLKHALEALMANQDMERCSIFLLDGDGSLKNVAGLDWEDMLRGLTHAEIEAASVQRIRTQYRLGDGVMGRAAESGTIQYCRSCADDPQFENYGPDATPVDGSLICVPISCEERVLGVLNVFYPQAGFFNTWHERLLLLFCQVLGRLLLNHRFTNHLGNQLDERSREIEYQRAFLQSVMDGAPDPIMVIGTDYRLLMANGPARRNGLPSAGGLPRTCHEFSHHRDTPCDSAEHQCPLRMVVAAGSPVSVVHEHFDHAGRVRLIELLASPLRNKDGAIIGIIESGRDITERKRIEAELQKTDEWLKEAQRIAHIGSWELDIATDRVICSEEALHVLQLPRDSFDGTFNGFIATLQTEDREQASFNYTASIRNRRPFHGTYRVPLADGGMIYVDFQGETSYGDEGVALRSIGTVQDVTEHVLREAALRESEEQFRTIADYTYDWEYWQGPGGEILFMSPSCKTVTGYSQGDFISNPELINRIVHPEDRHLLDAYRKDIGKESEGGVDFRIIRRDGEIRWLAYGCRAVYAADGRFLGRRASTRDVTDRVRAEEALRESEARFRLLFNAGNDAILVHGVGEDGMPGLFIEVNDRACELLGYSRAELYGMSPADIDVAESATDSGEIVAKLSVQKSATFERVHRAKDGRRIPVEISAHLFEFGGKLTVLSVVRDITERKQAELEYKTVLQTATDGYLVVDAEGRFLDTNDAYCTMIGYTRAEALRLRIADVEAIESPGEVGSHSKRIRSQGYDRFETRHRRKDGRIIDVEVSVTYLDIRGGVMIVFVRDVTERKEAELQIRQLAYYDTLTNLPNRRLLLDRFDHALAQAQRYRRSLAVMFLDLDRFKQINDSLGHDAGDELLRQVARRLNSCVRAGDTVARSGGDEFVIVLAEIAHQADAALVAEKIIDSFGEPVQLAGQALRVTTSIGIAVYSVGGGDDVQALMKKADAAMYEAKEAGRNGYRFFSS